MEHYVTILNSQFLPQGLALYRSMQRHAGKFTLWVLCVDELAFTTLGKLAEGNLRPLNLSALETEALRRVKGDRTIGEYCWTLTPFAPKFVFNESNEVDRVTYIDADLWFLASPAPVFEEFEATNCGVQITLHGYDPRYDDSSDFGKYCVQFVTFHRNHGEVVRQDWADKCLAWCYGRLEDGKFGDQKYLDDWPGTYGKTVNVYSHNPHFLAPWNAFMYPYSEGIVWHFHGFRIHGRTGRRLFFFRTHHPIPVVVSRYVYGAYERDLDVGLKSLADVGIIEFSQCNLTWSSVLKYLIAPFVRFRRSVCYAPLSIRDRI